MSEDIMHSEEEQEVDVLSLLATQSDTEVDEEEDEAPETLETALEQIQALRERVSKRNKSLRKSKDAQHRTQDEYNALAERLEALEQRPSPTNDRSEQQEQEALAWRDRVDDDPKEAIGYVDSKLASFEDRMARFMESKFGEISGKMTEWQGATNPERREYAKQMETLRGNPAFASLDDDTLLTVAKGLATAKVKTPPAGIGGNRGGKSTPKAPVVTEEDLRKMGFDT